MPAKGHRVPMSERFWCHVEKTDECWNWTGWTRADGYGHVREGGRASRPLRAHRVSYELLVGPIPGGLTLDHLCGNRRCVRPDHLEPVTSGENSRRAFAELTHCKRGHEYTPENTHWRKGTQRVCRACGRINDAKRRDQRRVYDAARYAARRRAA